VHFFAVSAQLMRRILVDDARSRNYQKRGAGRRPVSLEEEKAGCLEPDLDFVALDDALHDLVVFDPRKSKVVEVEVLWRAEHGRDRGGPAGMAANSATRLETGEVLARWTDEAGKPL
jgi:ECF sigma factor